MANEMQGMFGQDPALIEQALRQQQDAGIAQQAQMDPWSAVAYGAGTGASRLAGGIGGMLGYEAPEMKQANTVKRVQEESMAEAKAMGIDPAKDMEKFGEIVSNKYNMYGMPDKAFGVQQLIQGMKAQQAKTALDQASATAKLREKQYTVVGKNAINNATGEWITPPISATGVDVNNKYDAVQFLSKIKEMQRNGQEIPRETLDTASALYSDLTSDKIDMQGNKISGLPIPHLNPISGLQTPQQQPQGGEAPFAVTLSDKGKEYLNNLMSKGVREDVAARAVQKIGGDLIVPTDPALLESAGIAAQPIATGERKLTQNPAIERTNNIKQAFEIEQRYRDDYTKAIEKPKLVLEASEQIRELAKNPTPTNLNAMATIGQHLIEPTNQALQNEINRLMGGGSLLEQVKGLVSKVVSGTASPEQIKWFNAYAEDMRNAGLRSYKSTLTESYDTLKKYSSINKEIDPNRVVSAMQLARFEGVPFVRTPEEASKLPHGTEFYTPDSLTKRIKK